VDNESPARPVVDILPRMKTIYERTNMLCESCGAAVLIERRDIPAVETFVRDQRLVCEAAPDQHAIWQGFR